MKGFLRDLGPVLAGFQLATYLVGFFGIGAFASWVLNTWRPFTHWVWDSFFSWLTLPLLSELEKDALTAVVFFLPMALWAAYNRFIRGEKGPFSIVTIGIAFVAGIGFVYLVAGTLIIETIQLAVEGLRDQERNNLSFEELFNSATNENLSSITTLVSAIAGLLTVLAQLFVITNRKRYRPYYLKIFGFAEKEASSFDSDQQAKLDEMNRAHATRNERFTLVFTFIGMLAIAGLLSGVASNIGWVRGIAVFSITGCIIATLMFDPRRLLVSTGAFLAFVLSSLGYEFALWVFDQMNKVSG